MAAKILITRTVPEDKAKEMIPLVKQMRALATTQPGYISGETLKSSDRPDTFLVISTWQSVTHWQQWATSRTRMQLQQQIDAALNEKTEYEIYQYS